MRKLLLLLLLFTFGCFGLNPNHINPNHNWNKASFEKAPGVVAITIDAQRPYCSGVLIKRNMVLTAGHCLDDFEAKKMYITHGCNHVEEEYCTHTQVRLKIFNPGYDYTPGLWNDLGILITENDITEIETAEIGTFRDIRLSKDLGRGLITAGFGKRPNDDIGILYMGFTSIREHYMYEFLTNNNGYNGPCRGDSGGPAYARTLDGKLKVVGILSRSQRDLAICGGRAKYTIPILYMDWVEEMYETWEEAYGDE